MTDKPPIPPILNDLPTDKDELDFEPYVEALADILLDPNTHTPLVLGVFGSWGSGKTSLMKMLSAKVTSGASLPARSVRAGVAGISGGQVCNQSHVSHADSFLDHA